MKATLALLTLLPLTGCFGSDANVDAPPATAEQPLVAPAATTTTDQICRSLMQRQRACTDDFIPALVDARVRIDNPPGVADRERSIGRDALVKEALTEWANDSQDAAIESVCDEIAQSVSPTRDAELRDAVSQCLAQTGCEAFVACAVPLNLARWKP